MSHYPPEGRPSLLAAIEAGAREGTPWDLELPFVTAKGNPRWVRSQGVALCEDGQPVCLLGAFQDITEKKNNALELHRLNEELTRLSTTDALTEVGNRRLFDQTLKSEWLRAARRQGPIGLLMIDVDHFKLYNDTYGHPEGDTCLTKLGETLAGIAADIMGFAARYGGEEFCLLLPNSGALRAMEVGETVRAAIQGLALPHATSSHKTVTVSIGVASTLTDGSQRPGDLIEAADAALYAAKHRGRNTVVEHGFVRLVDEAGMALAG
jgi:diguanylate cyclase (GGDEF)-like protein